MNNVTPRSGYDLAAKILETHPADAIETMLKYSNGAECDWLEFKAGMTLQLEDVEKRNKPDDLYWDYVLSIVAMANTRGGAFVIGVNDQTHEPVPLQSCDPRHVIEKRGKEAYLREEIVDKFDRPDRKWTTKDGTVWGLPTSIVPFIDARTIPYRDSEAAVILVSPNKPGEELFVSRRIRGGDEYEDLPIRKKGEVGRVKRLTKRTDCDAYISSRKIELDQFGVWWGELDAEQQVAHADETLDNAIRAYHAKLEEETRKKLRAFIPLDAEGNELDEGTTNEEEFEDPQAISVFDDEDDDWLNPTKTGGVDSESDLETVNESDEEDDSDEPEEDYDDSGEDATEKTDQTIRIGLAELLEQKNRVILVGEPGAGKTTCLAHFSVQQSKKERPRPHLFAFIALGRWIDGGSVRGLIERTCGLSQTQIDTLLEERRIHLVLDALNECPDRFRPAAVENIRLLLRDHPDIPVVLSSRKAEGIRLPGIPVFEVQSMDRERQRLFLVRYLRDENAADRILDSLTKQPGGESIAQNPMLLRMVVDVVRVQGDLPTGRATLYRCWLENWYDREELKARKAKDALPWSKEESIRLLSRLAFAGRVEGYRDIPVNLARRALDDADGGFLDRLCQGPLLEIDEGFVHFRHETIQEYLCAEWLLAEPTTLGFLPEKDYDTWGMPISYATELRLPGKLPNELAAVVWRMNPWIAALSVDLSSIPYSYANSPDTALSAALLRGDNLRNDSLLRCFQEELSQGRLFLQPDPALSYLVHLSETNEAIWRKFEASYLLSTFSTLSDERETRKEIEEWFGIKSPRKNKKRSSQLPTKIQNLILLTQENMVSTIQRLFPEEPLGHIITVFFKCFSQTDINAVIHSLILQYSSNDHSRNKVPLPIEIVPALFGLHIPLSKLGKLFGADFVPLALSSMIEHPERWTFPRTVRFLLFLAKQGIDVRAAVRAYLRTALFKLDRLFYSPPSLVLERISSLCSLLGDDDGSLLLPPLSRFGKLLLRSIGFPPEISCPEFYQGIEVPIDEAFPLSTIDLNDDNKRAVAVMSLFGRCFRLELVKVGKGGKYVFLRTPAFSEVVVCFTPSLFGTKPVLGSFWKARIRVQPRTNPNNESQFGFVADVIEPWISPKMESLSFGPDEAIEKGEVNNRSNEEASNEHNPARKSFLKCFLRTLFEKEKMEKASRTILSDAGSSKRTFRRELYSSIVIDWSPPSFQGVEKHENLFLSEWLLYSDYCRTQIERFLASQTFDFVVTSSNHKGVWLNCSGFFRRFYCPHSVFPEIQLVKNDQNAHVIAEVCIRLVKQKWKYAIRRILAFSSMTKDTIAPPSQLTTKPICHNESFAKDPVLVSCANNTSNKNGDFQSKKPEAGKIPAFSIKNNRVPIPSKGISKGFSPMSIPSAIHVYIDEAWPGFQDHSKKDTGVIAGIVWMGTSPNENILPFVETHLRANGGQQLNALLRCDKAFPFAFPICFSRAFEPSPEKYLELLSESMVVLLGWVLPRPVNRTKVFIHAEQYGTFKDGADETESFRALFAGAAMTLDAERLSRWSVEKVEWQGKNFGYIPYGDLVAYLFAETPDAKRMAREFQVDRWPGCVPFSPELLPALRDLDAGDPAGAAGALFRLSGLCGESMLFRHSLRSLLDSAKVRTELRDAVLVRLCDEFERKDRDLRKLGRIADAFFAAFPDEAFEDRPKPRFLRLLASLQQANHDGSPAAADEAFRLYDGLRAEMAKRDFELCLYADLNVAVHFNDRFEFEKAESLLRRCREAPSFPFLSVRDRGRLLSSLGQSAALLGRHAEADRLFREALAVFSELPGELEDEADQTRVYRAFAALDAVSADLPARLEEALGISISEAVTQPDALAGQSYHEHLLVKSLWFLVLADADPATEWTASYLSTCSGLSAAEQHPWEMILLYRGLLAWKTDHALANRFFDEWDEWFRAVPHGETLSLICGFGLVAIHRHCGRELDGAALESLLRPVAEALPSTAPTVDSLLRIGEDDSPDSLAELWSLLPFNYK